MMICIPIVARTNEEALLKMERSFPLSDVIELRIDSIRNVDLSELIAAKRGKILITNRKMDEGGRFEGSERERVTLLKEAVKLGAEFVDIELSTENTLIEELLFIIRNHDNKTKLIVSHHDFNRTSSEKELKDRFNECLKAGADIVKLITYANSMEDNLMVLNLIPYAKRKNGEIIAFCMGDLGRISRAMAPLLGSYLSFASLEKGDESAPGQMTAREMKQIFRILR
ncbi:unnamed protein product [marine sediment metagenome]|uniref:3-dehydroquinate dehydratase n=1 Tax=marine sediment metagenome TaxID=412755 RepID=X1RHS9_9ZZZZ